MKALNIKPIKNSEILTARLINERKKGNFDVHTTHINQTNTLLEKLVDDDIYNLTPDELQEIGEYIEKIKELVYLITSNDSVLFLFLAENISSFKKKYTRDQIAELVSKKNYNSKETYNLRIKAYAHLLEININTCHFVLNKFKSNEISLYNKIKLNNLIEAIWSGLAPEELKIMFGMSQKESGLLFNSLYVEKEDMFNKLGDKFKKWQTTFVETSASINEILNKRLNEALSAQTDNPNLDYTKIAKLYDLDDVNSAKLAAEVSVKILFYLKLYPTMKVDNLRASLEELVKKDHEWSKSQLDEIKRLGKTKAEYVKDLKEVLLDKTGESLNEVKSQTIAAICELNENSYRLINEMFVDGFAKDLTLSFEDITNIITLMRTTIKSECIQHIFKLDNETIKNFNKLFKSRI